MRQKRDPAPHPANGREQPAATAPARAAATAVSGCARAVPADILQDLAVGEVPISLGAVVREPCVRRDGRKLHIATPFRWAKQGVGGVRLEWVKVGGTMCTTRPALLRFIHRLSDPSASPAGRSPLGRRQAHDKAEAELDAHGI